MRLESHSLPQQHDSLIALMARNGAKGVVIKLIGITLAFILFLVISHSTNSEQYGYFATAFSYASILSFVGGGGQAASILRFWPALDHDYGPIVAHRATLAGLIISASGGGLLFLTLSFARQLGLQMPGLPLGADAYQALGALAILLCISEYAMAALRAHGHLVTALAPREVVWRALVIVVVGLWPEEVGASEALLMVSLCLLLATFPQGVILVRRALASRGKRIPKTTAHQMVRSVWGLWGMAVAGPLSEHINTIIVAVALGPIQAGAYFTADRVARLLSIGLTGGGIAAAPIMARAYHAGEILRVRSTMGLTAIAAASFAILGLLAYLVLGGMLLRLFNDEYGAAVPALLILGVGQVINAAAGPNGTLLALSGHERVALLATAVWAVLSGASVYVSAASWGLTGAAAASAVCVVGWNASLALACRCFLQVGPMRSIATGAEAIKASVVNQRAKY